MTAGLSSETVELNFTGFICADRICPYRLFARGLGYIPSGRRGGKDFSDDSGAARRGGELGGPDRIDTLYRPRLHLHPRMLLPLLLFRIISNRPECWREGEREREKERSESAIHLAINRLAQPAEHVHTYVRAMRSGAPFALLPRQSLRRFTLKLSPRGTGNINQTRIK